MALRFLGFKFGISLEKKMKGLFLFISVAFFCIFLRLFYVQILNYPAYRSLSDTNSLRLIPERAPRGLITDRNGEILASNVPTYSLFLVPAGLRTYGPTLIRLSEILGEPLESIESLVESRRQKRKFEPIRLMAHLDEELIAKIEENLVHLPGVYIQLEPERHYPHGKLASHALGHIGEVSEADLLQSRESGYAVGDWIGKKGIERTYDSYLRGENGGVQVEVDASGVQRRTLAHKKPIQGQTLMLSLDYKIQKLAEDLLGDNRGAIVVTNPQTGEILAMVSKPNFDPNDFVGGISYKQWNKLIKDKDHPLQDRAIQGLYPPGSIFKLVTALAALEDHVIDLDKTFLCTGNYWIKVWVYRCDRRSGHGWVNMKRAIIESCDIFFYQLALLVKVEKIYRTACKLGLGSKTKVDLDSEAIGFVPNPRWKESTQHLPWFPGNTVQMSIGQGYLTATPLQMLDITSALAMNGNVYTPHLFYRLVDQHTGRILGEKKPEELRQVGIDPGHLAFLRDAMEQVVSSPAGTGKKARIKGVRVAGKTGTSENPFGDSHSWFTAYAPVENPQVAVIVMVENGGWGGEVAAPIAKRIMEAALGQEVTPWQSPTPGTTPQASPVPTSTPVRNTAP